MEFESHQHEALEKAYDLLKEHFDAALIVVSSEVDPEKADATCCYWSGGYMRALGHARYADNALLARNSLEKECGPEGDGEGN